MGLILLKLLQRAISTKLSTIFPLACYWIGVRVIHHCESWYAWLWTSNIILFPENTRLKKKSTQPLKPNLCDSCIQSHSLFLLSHTRFSSNLTLNEPTVAKVIYIRHWFTISQIKLWFRSLIQDFTYSSSMILVVIYSGVIFHLGYHPFSIYISGPNWVHFRHCLIRVELARVMAMARKNHSWTSICWEVGIIWSGND